MATRSRRIVACALLALGTSPLLAGRAEALPACTNTYERCIDEARDGGSWITREMSYIECFAGWVGCVKAKAGF